MFDMNFWIMRPFWSRFQVPTVVVTGKWPKTRPDLFKQYGCQTSSFSKSFSVVLVWSEFLEHAATLKLVLDRPAMWSWSNTKQVKPRQFRCQTWSYSYSFSAMTICVDSCIMRPHCCRFRVPLADPECRQTHNQWNLNNMDVSTFC